MRYQWILDAAGKNEQRLAELSLLLAGAAMATSMSMTREKALPFIFEIREVMHEVSVRMNLDMSDAMKELWGDIGQA